MSHHITKCRDCSKVLGECRCPSKDKLVRYDTCIDCKRRREREARLSEVDSCVPPANSTPGPEPSDYSGGGGDFGGGGSSSDW